MSTARSQKACILGIDFQEIYRPDSNPKKISQTTRIWESVLKNTNKLMEEARAVLVPIVHFTHIMGYVSQIVPYGDGWDAGMDLLVRKDSFAHTGEMHDSASSKECRASDVADTYWKHFYRLIPDADLHRSPEDFLCMKSTRNVFCNTGLTDFLAQRNISDVYCTGYEAQDCVSAAAYFGKVHHHFHTVIVSDCTNGLDPSFEIQVAQNEWKTMRDLEIEFLTADEAVARLQSYTSASAHATCDELNHAQ